MSPEKPTDEQVTEGEEQAKPKPAAAKKSTAAEKTAATKSTDAKKSATKAATDDEPVAEKKQPAKKPAARKPAAKKAEKEPIAGKSAEKKSSEKESTAAKPVDKEPVAEKPAAEPKEKPAAATRETKSAPSRRKVVRAQARYVRTSARKARMVCGHLRGKSVPEARAILAFTPREVARDWSKLLESAVANAENNHELIEDDLFVREAYADEGPTIKRFRPRAQGRATPIRKRTSHLTITLTPKP
jgi:ribosomal protein L22